MRALIIKIAAIGDTIIALPMVAALRRRHPTADVTFICSETMAEMVRLACQIETIPVDEPRLFTDPSRRKPAR
jgi:ADP-heptose:LPS heptosyltransferase